MLTNENRGHLTEEERQKRKDERLQEKLDKKKRKGYKIPGVGKKGMSREKQFQDEWNDFGKTNQKKYNVKKRLSIDDETKEEGKEESPQSNLRVPIKRTKKKTINRGQEFNKKAQRTPNSGATWHSKGDVKLSHALVEVKERSTVNGRGEKTISIPKEWLTKQADEAFEERRNYWYLAFAYSGDDEIYIIKPYNHELEIVHEYEELKEKYSELEKKYNELKNKEED